MVYFNSGLLGKLKRLGSHDFLSQNQRNYLMGLVQRENQNLSLIQES